MERIETTVTGGCQCGAVRYRATAMLDNAHICHCRMCQKAVGNLFAALVAAPRDALILTRGTPATFRSSEHVDRGFCPVCGTPLFYDFVKGSRVNLTIGSLDDPSLFQPKEQYGIEGRVPFFEQLSTLPGETTTDEDMGDAANAIQASNHQHPDHDTDHWPA
jgi:hypothetical protein